MGGRTTCGAASVGTLCGWLAAWTIGTSAQGGADDTGQAATLAPSGTPAPNPVSQVVLRVAANWDFRLEDPNEHAGTELWVKGAAGPHFACGPEASGSALDNETLAARKLELLRAPASLSSQLWELSPAWGAQAKEQGLQVTNASVLVLPVDPADKASPVLLAKLDPLLPSGTTLQVLPERDGAAPLSVEYDCLRHGQAMIELRLHVLDGYRSGEMCMRWKKVCRMGWRSLQVTQGNLVAVKDGDVTEEWNKEMGVKGTYETVTKLQLSAIGGLLRLGQPTVSTSSALLDTSLRGPLGPLSLDQDDACEIAAGEPPVMVSVVYTCKGDGAAEIVLTLIKAGKAGESLELRWKKICGETVYHHLQVWLKSDTYKNSTQVADNGMALPGFMRPCPGKAQQAIDGTSTSSSTTQSPNGCEASPLIFEVSSKDRRTSLELRMDLEGTSPPEPKPPPDLSYNRKLMQVTLMQPRSVTPGGSSVKHKLHALHIKYTCFKDGVGVVGITLHLPGYKPVDVAWNKRCAEPKVHVGKGTMTAPQAILVTLVICSIVGLVCCLIFIFCGQDDKRGAFQNGATGGDDEELELTNWPRKHASRAVVPQRFGGNVDSDDEGDVAYS